MSAKKLFLAVALVAGFIAGPAAAHEAVRVAPPFGVAVQLPGASVYYGAAPYVVPAPMPVPVYVARPYYGHPYGRYDHHAHFDRRFEGHRFEGPHHRVAWR